MKQKALIIDVTKCTACFDCFIACKDEFAGQSWLPYNEAQPDTGQYWIQVDEIERGQFPQVKGTFVPIPCMMCQDPLCVKAAKNNAAYKYKLYVTKAAGMYCIVTTYDYTENEDFAYADLVVPELGDPPNVNVTIDNILNIRRVP